MNKDLDIKKLLGSNHTIEQLTLRIGYISTDPSNVTPEILKMKIKHEKD
jgi:hypothetical protein